MMFLGGAGNLIFYFYFYFLSVKKNGRVAYFFMFVYIVHLSIRYYFVYSQ